MSSYCIKEKGAKGGDMDHPWVYIGGKEEGRLFESIKHGKFKKGFGFKFINLKWTGFYQWARRRIST